MSLRGELWNSIYWKIRYADILFWNQQCRCIESWLYMVILGIFVKLSARKPDIHRNNDQLKSRHCKVLIIGMSWWVLCSNDRVLANPVSLCVCCVCSCRSRTPPCWSAPTSSSSVSATSSTTRMPRTTMTPTSGTRRYVPKYVMIVCYWPG